MDPLIVAAMREQLYRADVARTMPGFRYIALAEWATNYGISLLDRIDTQAKRIKELEAEVDRMQARHSGDLRELEQWKRLSLVADEITDARIADMLEQDAAATGHAFSDAAAVFMRKATRLQRECDVIRASRDDLEDERHRLSGKAAEREAERDALKAEAERLREQVAMLRQPTVAVVMAYDAGREAGRKEVQP